MPQSACANCYWKVVICIRCWICPAAPLPVRASKPWCSFLKKARQTRKVWFYQLNLDRNLGKTNPLNENDLAEFVKLQKQVRKKFITNKGKNQFRNGKRLAKNACSVPKKRISIFLFRFIKGKAISYHIFLSYKELFVKIYFFIID